MRNGKSKIVCSPHLFISACSRAKCHCGVELDSGKIINGFYMDAVISLNNASVMLAVTPGFTAFVKIVEMID